MTREQKNRAVAKRYSELTTLINKLKKEQDELKGYIKVETNETNADWGTWLITYTERKTPTVDAKRLQAELPEVFAEYGKMTDSRILKVKATK